MGFWKNIFQKKKREEWEDFDEAPISESLEHISEDFRREEARSRFVTDRLERIGEAQKEMELLSGEYNLVTSYLTDMEEIEALPLSEKEGVCQIAQRILSLESERTQYHGRKNRMSDADFARIKKNEAEVAEGIEKIKECEQYAALIRQDLQRLDGERHAYEYRCGELRMALENGRGVAKIVLIAFGACVFLLLILQFAFEYDTKIGYLLASLAAAVAVAVLFVRYTEEAKELERVKSGINKLILLQNKVKIRYVNNTSLMEYLYMKYDTDNGAKLEKLWAQYQEEKEERKQFAEAEAKLEYYQKQLVSAMNNYHIANPGRWVLQPAALLDKREMVEIRHDLILRRQSLRKQMDYNTELAKAAKEEIMDLVHRYPAYAEEVLSMVDRFDSSIDLQ